MDFGMQWHQLDHLQTILAPRSRQITTPTLNFYRPDALPDVQPTLSQSQEGDWARPHLCTLARHGP